MASDALVQLLINCLLLCLSKLTFEQQSVALAHWHSRHRGLGHFKTSFKTREIGSNVELSLPAAHHIILGRLDDANHTLRLLTQSPRRRGRAALPAPRCRAPWRYSC